MKRIEDLAKVYGDARHAHRLARDILDASTRLMSQHKSEAARSTFAAALTLWEQTRAKRRTAAEELVEASRIQREEDAHELDAFLERRRR